MAHDDDEYLATQRVLDSGLPAGLSLRALLGCWWRVPRRRWRGWKGIWGVLRRAGGGCGSAPAGSLLALQPLPWAGGHGDQVGLLREVRPRARGVFSNCWPTALRLAFCRIPVDDGSSDANAGSIEVENPIADP